MPYRVSVQLLLEHQPHTLLIICIHTLESLFSCNGILKMLTASISTVILETQWHTTKKLEKRFGNNAMEKLTTFS